MQILLYLNSKSNQDKEAKAVEDLETIGEIPNRAVFSSRARNWYNTGITEEKFRVLGLLEMRKNGY